MHKKSAALRGWMTRRKYQTYEITLQQFFGAVNLGGRQKIK